MKKIIVLPLLFIGLMISSCSNKSKDSSDSESYTKGQSLVSDEVSQKIYCKLPLDQRIILL